jgi:YVTN family beta-propeller protein
VLARKFLGRPLVLGLLGVAVAALLLSTLGPSLAGVGSAIPGFFGSPPARSGAPGHGATAAPPDPPALPPKLIATLAVGAEPEVGATDLANGLVYVVDTIGDEVSVLDGTSVSATIDLATNQTGGPNYVVYDALDGFVYVVDQYNSEGTAGAVSVINGTSVIAVLPVGQGPEFAVVDPATGWVYVLNGASDTVSVLNRTTVVGAIPVGQDPVAAAFDALDGYGYVANRGSANVSLVFAAHLVGSLPAGSEPASVAYDPLDGFVYVANNASNNVTVYSDTFVTGNVPAGTHPSFVAFNPSVGGAEVANAGSNNVSVLNGTTTVAAEPVAAGPVWVGPGPTGVFTFVVDQAADRVTLLQGFTVLPSVAVGDQPTSGVSDPVNQLEYVINAATSNVSVFGPAYPVTFNETGLAPGVDWSVSLGGSTNSSTTSSIGFAEALGSYAYTVGTPAGYLLVSASPPSPITVTDASVVVAVTFARLASENYTLTFTETGLGKQCSSPGGGGEGPEPSWGCCKSTALTWGVTVDGVTKTTTSSSLAFSEPDGTYSYAVLAPAGYTVTSSVPSSPVTVEGANLTVNVTFATTSAPVVLSVSFHEYGLRYGTVWCVTLAVTECSSGRTIVFSGLSSGTYAFNVSAVRGYTARPSEGSVTLTTHDLTVDVKFTSTTRPTCGG